MDTWIVVSIVAGCVLALLAVFAVTLFVLLRKENRKNNFFEKELVVSLLTRNDLRPWARQYEKEGYYTCLCTTAFVRTQVPEARKFPKNALIQAVYNGETLVAARLIRYETIDGALSDLLARGNGIVVFDEGGAK